MSNRSLRPGGLLGLALVVFLVAFPLGPAARAAQTFEELNGWFAMEIPDDWELAPQTDDTVFVFMRGSQSFIFQYAAEADSLDPLFTSAIETARSAGLGDLSQKGKAEELAVNGHPARRATFSSHVSAGKVKVELHARIAAVVLGEGGLSLLVIAAPKDLQAALPAVDAVFSSIRDAGEGQTGSSAAVAVESDLAAATAWKPLSFESEQVSMDLPAGWIEQPRRQDFEKVVFGFFTAKHMQDASLIGTCESKMGLNQGKLVKAAKVTVEAAFPNAAPVKAYETEGEGRSKKMAVVVYEGSAAAKGQEVPMCAVTASFKADDCWINLIGIGARGFAEQLEQEVVGAANSIH